MKHEIQTAYVGVGTADPAAMVHFLSDVIGLMPGEPTADGAATLRNDAKAHRVIVEKAAKEDATFIGFEAVDAAAFERVLERLTAHGVVVSEESGEARASRRVQRLVRMDTPFGIPVELVLGLRDAATPFHSASFPEGFVTGAQGFGHVVLALGEQSAYDAARRFAIEALGLRMTDWLDMPIEGGLQMHVTFLHCNARHHSMALACIPVGAMPQTLHHINFEVSSVDPVGAALERVLAAKAPVANLIGKHQNDGMISFYSTTPGGWHVEIGATGRTVGDDWDDVKAYHKISEWGHQPPQVIAAMQPAHAASITSTSN